MIYIRLYHGRADKSKQMGDWGQYGPTFGPFTIINTIYVDHIKLFTKDGGFNVLRYVDDMLYYDGMFYGEHQIFLGGKNVKSFDQLEANLPEVRT